MFLYRYTTVKKGKIMVSPVPALNLFTQAAPIQGINPTKSGMPQAAAKEFSGENPFAPSKSNTVGVNTNIGVGDTSYVANQLGRSGTARTLAFA